MVFADIVPIAQTPMSVYTALLLILGALAITTILKYLVARADNHAKRIGLLETKTVETNVIVKRIDKNMDSVMSESQKLNAEVIKHLLKGGTG